MLEALNKSMFSEHLGEKFRVHLGSSHVMELELIEVTGVGSGSSHARGRREPFSIVFRGPHDSPLGQGTYKIEHDKMGTFDLFLVPIVPDENGLNYEAVFT